MKYRYIFIAALLSFTFYALSTAEEENTDVNRVGQIVPEFSVKTIDESNIDIKDLRGKIVLINFFATWCPHCINEMPYLENLWNKLKDKDFLIICIGREHSKQELVVFRDKKGFTFPIAPDPERKIYSLFATKYIPRNIVVDKAGKIVYQKKGFIKEEFQKLANKIESLLSE